MSPTINEVSFMRSLLFLGSALCLLSPANPARAQFSDERAALHVEARWLNDHLHDKNLVLLHVGPPKGFDKGHIAGARWVSTDDVSVPHDMSQMGKPGVLTLEMSAPEALHDQLERLGISDDSRIVVYFDEEWISPSTRVVLALDYAGLGRRTSLLDGGLPAWMDAGFALSRDRLPPPPRGHLAPLHLKPVLATAAFVRENVGKPGRVLIDARDAVFFDGVEAGGSRQKRVAGHIAGARSLPFTQPWDSAGRLLPVAELAKLFERAGVKQGDTVIGYCHIGQQATAMLFAARALGLNYLLYDGSFEEWSLNDGPVENPHKGGQE